MKEILFWSSIVFVLYVYVGYPALLFVLSKVRNRPTSRGNIEPFVTVIIAAHNEQKVIRQKLENTLCLEYRRDKLEIFVASDCSTDRTHAIVLEYKDRGITLVATRARKGKEFAQHEAIKRAKGEIIIFTDASIMLRDDAIRSFVSNFYDKSVGCVTCEDALTESGSRVNGESLYTQYEMWIRRMESQVGSVVGLSGFLFAARRSLCQDWSDHLASDFFLLLTVVKKGYRGISDPQTVGHYQTVRSVGQEFNRKIRTILRGITVVMHTISILNPKRYGFFAVQVLSHKLMKWCVPLFLGLLIITNLFLLTNSMFFQAFALAQILFYGAALVGLSNHRLNRWLPFRVASFFVAANSSIVLAWAKYLMGERIIFWEPSKRQG